VTTSAQLKDIAEYIWTAAPWLISALCVAAAVQLLAVGEGDMCISCHLADGMAQSPAYPPIASNKCIEVRSAVDPMRAVLNCGSAP
jgi:cytochrome c553